MRKIHDFYILLREISIGNILVSSTVYTSKSIYNKNIIIIWNIENQ